MWNTCFGMGRRLYYYSFRELFVGYTYSRLDSLVYFAVEFRGKIENMLIVFALQQLFE